MTPRIALVLTDKGIETIAQMFKSYQEEATRREWVRTHYATLLGKVKAEQESLLRYYEMKFAERRETLAEFYSLLHKAVETGNDLHLQGALYGILETIKADPLADYGKFVRTLQDPGTPLEI
jgi:hypothetical protein